MKIQVIPYSPRWHSLLLDYMRKVYPNRDEKYLEWWLSNIDSGDEDDWLKCFIVFEGDEIIGCTTAIPMKFIKDGVRTDFYLRGNTIISPEKRGRGVSKLLYDKVNSYNNWLSVGITDIAWKIQPKYVKNFTPIQPIRIYVLVNLKILGQLIKKMFNCKGKKEENFVLPEMINIGTKASFVKVNDIGQLDVPQSGCWTDDKVEIIRDKNYLGQRFFSIYCAQRYGVYKYEKSGKLRGYVVLRKMHYAGLDMVSVVDYRFMDKNEERLSYAAADRLARKNNIGLVLGMSSRRYKILGVPILVRARKILNCAVGIKEIDFNDMLFTSADSDLDFVYYG